MSFDYDLPHGWSWKTIEEVQESSKGATITGPFGSSIGKKFFVEKGVPVIRGNNLSLDMIPFIDNGFVYVSEEKAEELKRYKSIADDLLFTAAGTIGQVGIIPKKSKYEEYIISNKQLRARLNTTIVDPTYAYYWFSSKPMVEYIKRQNTGSTIPLINLGVLRSLPLPVPSLDVQFKVRNILGSFDKKIWLNRQTNQTLEEMAQAIFKSWFVDFDPVKAKMNGEQPEGMDAATASIFPEKLVESELGLIPDGWKVLPSEKVANVAIGKTPPRKEPQWFSEDNKDVTWISIRDMGKSGMYALDSSEYLTQESVDKFNVKVIPDNTLILSFKLTVGRVAITHGEMTTNEAIAHYKLSDDAPVSTNYLYSYMKQFNFESLGSTSSIAKAVNSKIIKALPVIVPSKDILGSFDTLVKPLFDKIKSNQIETQNLEVLRDTLLPKLLSGEIELGTSEELVEAI
ncbi:restriction endonuclease subunit S [Photobacterium kishitanii]|uniref:restriction endonuclease subunit S n=1 Tax=Photobacterium kishitanii TaxID=318456 RepID=UPI000D16980B|nr:restriction endonuclease subunit S [Photobacterium kishitanii]PSU95289.1 restriction endonuclease subunit S [Photobacterium kishitanii]